MPEFGDELHHFGWNACSSALCPYAPHPHVERRYLVVPGIRSSRIHIIDTKPESAKAEDRQSDRARRSFCAQPIIRVRIRFTAGRKAFTSARLERPMATARRHFHARLRDVRDSGSVGNGPRPTILALRFLVASGIRHAAQQRMGHAEHD